MAITSTGYGLEHNAAFAGMISSGVPSVIMSKTNMNAANLAYGTGVVASGTDGVDAPTSSSVSANFVGVLVRELNQSYQSSDTFGVPYDRVGSVMTSGVIWVTVVDAVSARDAVYLRVGATGTGQFTNAAGTGATLSVAVANAKFLTSAAAGGLAKLSLVVGG